MHVRYGLSCDRANILDLESSTVTKFSRHLIFHLPGAVFKNNIHAGILYFTLLYVYHKYFSLGHFVHYCCDQLRSFKLQADSTTDLQQAYDHHFPAPVATKRSRAVPQCPTGKILTSTSQSSLMYLATMQLRT